jgi:hypothetical protein
LSRLLEVKRREVSKVPSIADLAQVQLKLVGFFAQWVIDHIKPYLSPDAAWRIDGVSESYSKHIGRTAIEKQGGIVTSLLYSNSLMVFVRVCLAHMSTCPLFPFLGKLRDVPIPASGLGEGGNFRRHFKDFTLHCMPSRSFNSLRPIRGRQPVTPHSPSQKAI